MSSVARLTDAKGITALPAALGQTIQLRKGEEK